MSWHRTGSDIVASLRRLRVRFHDVEPAGDRPLGARRLKEPALSPKLEHLRSRPGDPGRGAVCGYAVSGATKSCLPCTLGSSRAASLCTATYSTSSSPGSLVLRRRGAAVRIHGRYPRVRAGLLGDLGFVIRSSDPAILELIRSRYEDAFVGANGTWYVRRHRVLPSADG